MTQRHLDLQIRGDEQPCLDEDGNIALAEGVGALLMPGTGQKGSQWGSSARLLAGLRSKLGQPIPKIESIALVAHLEY